MEHFGKRSGTGRAASIDRLWGASPVGSAAAARLAFRRGRMPLHRRSIALADTARDRF